MKDGERKTRILEYIHNTDELDMMTFYQMLDKSDLDCIGW